MLAKELLVRYQSVRSRTEYLCRPLGIEDYGLQAMADVSPAKWHLAHVTWFFEQFILIPYVYGYSPYHPKFALLFNSYYETAGRFFPRVQRGLLSRPTVEQVYTYRHYVDEMMHTLLTNPPPQHSDAITQRARLGLEHEIQHQELLLMDIRYNFSINPLQPAYTESRDGLDESVIEPLSWFNFSGGVIETGYQGEGFAYDNEGPRHQTLIPDFRLASRLVTNAEYLEFIQDRGYQRVELWLSDGWNFINTNAWQAPLYWRCEDDQWFLFDLTGQHPLPLNEPVAHLSFYEADAFARWAGKRLPTEAEWEHAASHQPIRGNFLDNGSYVPKSAIHSGLSQMYGDLWEWTQSSYQPYPGFKPLTGTLGEYNGKFMSGQMVLRGGCCVTAQDHIRASYRNFFRPADRWQFSGLRLAEDG